MELVMGALSWYAALPAAVMVMIGIFLVGLLLARLKVGQALRSSIYVAGAIVGMSTMVGMFSGAATPVLQTVVEATASSSTSSTSDSARLTPRSCFR